MQRVRPAFIIVSIMFVLLCVLILIGTSMQSDINGVKFKLDRVNNNNQLSISVMRCKYSRAVTRLRTKSNPRARQFPRSCRKSSWASISAPA